jgi:peptidoglycan/LPS O-acetylase OafA/YrhL
MRVRKWAAAFANLEATFLISLAVYLFARTVSSDVEELDAIIAEIIFLIAGAAGLFFAGRGILRAKRYGRGPIVMANLIALGVAYYMIDGDRVTWGITLGAIAITTAGLAIAAIPRQIGGNGSASL